MNKEHTEKKSRNHQSTFHLISTRVIVVCLAIWLLFCGLCTWIGLSVFFRYMEDRVYGLLSRAVSSGEQHLAEEDLHGGLWWVFPNDRIYALMRPHNADLSNTYSRDDYFEEVAYVFTEDNTEITSRPHICFRYTSEEKWLSGNTIAHEHAVVYMDILEDLNYPLEDNLDRYYSTNAYSRFESSDSCNYLMRLTGYFDSEKAGLFHPVSIASLLNTYAYTEDIREISSEGIEALNQADQQGRLNWETVATFVGSTAGKELQTIYAWDINFVQHIYEPLLVDGLNYEDLVDYIQFNCRDGMKLNDAKRSRSGNIFETVLMAKSEFVDSSYIVAIRCWPLKYTLVHLWHIYLISFLLIVLCMFFPLRKIRRNLTVPLEDMLYSRKIFRVAKGSVTFPEIIKLDRQIQDKNQKLSEANTEILRLNTALDYAKDAEENRRQLVSSLSHDLKTPIAIIHSYAEGLQEGISADKQNRYLSVIMEETECLDAMVLQMLDHSRLEAGKVRLASDRFSLLSVLRSITDKFAPMLEAKNISLIYTQAQDFSVTADEARIGHVLTNLVENALKYCPVNGTIQIALTKAGGAKPVARFTIENPSAPLSDEALEKIWTNFYRADPSRREPGTGLGLAIVKSIIDLHGGTCTVRNTRKVVDRQWETGVEFGFTLPLQ